MSTDIDPFADGESTLQSAVEEKPVSNRLGMSNVRQALSRWWIMLIFGVLGYFGALYYMSIKPPTNEAVTVLEVGMEDERLIGEGLRKNRLGADIILATEASKIMGPGILAETARSPEVQALQNVIPPKFSLKPRYMRTDEELSFKPASAVEVYELVDMMTKFWVSVEARRNTSLINVKVRHQDPDAARVIADALIKTYVEKQESQLVGGSANAFQILKQEADAARQDIEAAERSLQIYVAALKLSEELQSKRADVITLRQKYLPKHPDMIQMEAVYADLLKRFKREIKRSSQKASEKAHWLESREQMEALEAVIAKNDAESVEAIDEWVALAQSTLSSRASLLNATVEQKRRQYQQISQRMTEIDVADDKNLNNLKVVEPAFIGMAKESVRLIYLAVGSVLGVFAGFGVAYLLGVIDYKIYDVRSAEEASGLTCMAAVPASSSFIAQKGWQPVLQHDANSANAEAIRNLRASVVLLGRQEKNKVLLLTSSIPGEGKTTISAELAAAFALNKEKTLLIDMDLRRPRLTESFPELKNEHGIVEVLAGQANIEDVIHDTKINHLKVIASGNKAPNPSELLHEGEFATILKELATQFDRIILDSAPVLPVSDSRLLAKLAHSVILVVRSRKTPIGAMMRAHDLLRFAGAKVGGVVVNGMKRSGGSKYYGYRGFGEYGEEQYGYYGNDDE